jgi:uncharacterized membrane protein
MYGTRGQLAGVLAAILALFLALVVLIGAPDYPVSGVRARILFVAVAGIVGATVQRLVGCIRAQNHERDALLEELERVAHTDERFSSLRNELQPSVRQPVRQSGRLVP